MDAIAQHFGASRTVIRSWRQRYKLTPRRSRFARAEADPTPDEIEQRKREVRERHFAAMRALR
jgi:transposase-like protein